MIANIAPTEAVTPLRKAAIVFVLLGEEAGAELLHHMSEEEVRLISQEVARIGQISKEQSEKILTEFFQMGMTRRFANQGGIEFARKLLTKAFGADESRRLVDQLVDSMGKSLASFDPLQHSDPQQLARFVHNEHPQTIALVIAHLVPAQAAGLMSSLPAPLRSDVALRLARMEQISPEVAVKIAGVISKKLEGVAGVNREACGGVRAVADVCNRLDGDISREILGEIEGSQPDTADQIRRLMFVFEDILMLDETAMNEVVSRVDRKTLVLALKGTSEQLKQHFTKRMSSRAREMMFEDMDALGPVKIKDVEGAQQLVISAIRELEQQGTVSLRGSVGEQYVV
jgi:flagellar motor switch protein FliG